MAPTLERVALKQGRVRGQPCALAALQIVKQNIALSLIVKAIIMVLGATGVTGMWAAVFADVGVCLVAILNAYRAMKMK